MAGSRVKISHQYGEVYPNVWDDFAWAREHRAQLLEQYGECIILVFEQHVVGTGKTIEGAVEDAERRLPPEIKQVTPVIEILRHQNFFLRARPVSDPKEHT